MIALLALLTAAGTADSVAYDGSGRELEVRPPRVEAPRIEVDARLDEDEWRRAARLTGFTQYEPTEGIPAVEPTEVRVFYSSDAIYFGIEARDSRPEQIQASVAERDRSAFGDDWIRIMLDTYYEKRQAYIFYVNPYGIQTDGLWIEGKEQGEGGRGRRPVEFNQDFIWESRGRITEDGWVAEVRIPFVSLSFPERSPQTWGLNVAREVRRLGYEQSWAPLSKSVASTLAQEGALVGLRDLRPRTLVEVNPVATARWTGQRVDGEFVRDDVQPDVGFNARYGVTQNLFLGATVNPDFSQVEADDEQITVNERFAIFFPEKRPFFLDGTEIFQTPRRLVHTRTIVDPAAGVKLTGKLGAFDVAYLGAVDESPVSLDGGEHEALFNLVRVRRDLGGGSSAGLLYTDRTLLGGADFNRVAAADARILLDDGSVALTAQAAGSWTGREGEETSFDPLLHLALEKSGREFGWGLRYEDVAPEFETESGFIRRIGDARLFGTLRRDFYTEPGSFLQRWGVEVRWDNFFTHPGLWDGSGPYEYEIELQPSVSLEGSRWFGLIFRDGFYRFRGEDYADYRRRTPSGELEAYGTPDRLTHMVAGGIMSRVRISGDVRGGMWGFLRQVPIYSEGTLGRELLLRPNVNVQATDRLALELSYAYSRLWRESTEEIFSTADVSRLKVQYQFSPALFLRGIGQYNLERRDALRDPATGRPLWVDGEESAELDEGAFASQLLLSYEPSPGTIFYVGWNRQMEGPRTFRLGPMEPTAEGVFLKASYLHRL